MGTPRGEQLSPFEFFRILTPCGTCHLEGGQKFEKKIQNRKSQNFKKRRKSLHGNPMCLAFFAFRVFSNFDSLGYLHSCGGSKFWKKNPKRKKSKFQNSAWIRTAGGARSAYVSNFVAIRSETAEQCPNDAQTDRRTPRPVSQHP